ncbi:MAG: DUF362 domain-containing protein [Deltaproteobacteria bacterium]|jgi:uncharacterized protein (DUF362 family)|nr:DUF362 domain-containing protein [Deltaproteobacteria bacterium]
MNRRAFLKTLVGGAALLGAAGPLASLPTASASEPTALFPDLVAVKGADPAKMYAQAIAALGGLGRFVKTGQTVLIKPNMGWATPPEAAANTNPALLTALIENALAAGAKKVSVFDNTCDNWRQAYAVSGLEAAAKAAGAEVAPANQEKYFQRTALPGGRSLTETAYHELYLEADVVINVPVLKQHGGAKMTAALKNLMGAIWDRSELHSKGLDQTIPDLFLHKKPALNVLDAFRVMVSGGPRGYGSSAYVAPQMLLISSDPVAIDAAAARILNEAGLTAPDYIRRAAELGLGTDDLPTLNIQRLVS